VSAVHLIVPVDFGIAHLPGEDLDLMLPTGYNGVNNGATNIASATSDCDDCHDWGLDVWL